MENRYTENFQIVVDEAHVKEHSARWNSAIHDMRRVHHDLPDVAIMAAQKLPASDPAMLASRLSNIAPREIAAMGKERLNDADFALAVRRTHRSIAVQEVAGQMVSEREGVAKASDFLSLKTAIESNKGNQAGLVAEETLKRQGIDARRMLEGLKPAELKAVSVGAFDRVGEEGRDRIAAALEVEVSPERTERSISVASIPTMRPPRTQLSTPRRKPSFGQRMIAQHAMSNQLMSV